MPNHFITFLNCALVWCDYCRSYNHDTDSYPNHMNDVGGINFEKIMYDMIGKTIKTMKATTLQRVID